MTYEELKQAGFAESHRCAICNAPVGYMIHPELAVACFQSGCDCGGTYHNYRALTHEELGKVKNQ